MRGRVSDDLFVSIMVNDWRTLRGDSSLASFWGCVEECKRRNVHVGSLMDLCIHASNTSYSIGHGKVSVLLCYI